MAERSPCAPSLEGGAGDEERGAEAALLHSQPMRGRRVAECVRDNTIHVHSRFQMDETLHEKYVELRRRLQLIASTRKEFVKGEIYVMALLLLFTSHTHRCGGNHEQIVSC